MRSSKSSGPPQLSTRFVSQTFQAKYEPSRPSRPSNKSLSDNSKQNQICQNLNAKRMKKIEKFSSSSFYRCWKNAQSARNVSKGTRTQVDCAHWAQVCVDWAYDTEAPAEVFHLGRYGKFWTMKRMKRNLKSWEVPEPPFKREPGSKSNSNHNL